MRIYAILLLAGIITFEGFSQSKVVDGVHKKPAKPMITHWAASIDTSRSHYT